MEVVIEVVHRVSDNFGDPLIHLLNHIKKINENPNATKIVFDFKQCKFSSPFILGGIASLIDLLVSKGKEVEITEENACQNYLNTIHFPKGFPDANTAMDEIENKLTPFHNKTYIPVVSFPASKLTSADQIREKTLSAINSILKQQLNLGGNVLQGIYYLIDELTQNISDHSGSNKGYMFAQYYPSKNYMDLCIVDSGRGLMLSYNDNGRFLAETDVEAIKLALNGKSTKPDKNSRGFGIPTTRKMLVNGLKGKFFLWTGAAFMNQNIEKEEIIAIPEIYYWQGCLTALRIPIYPEENKHFNMHNFTE